MITGKLYDVLKYLAQIVLPALGTLYFTLAGIWGLGSGEEVVGTIMAVDLFLGVILGISQANYNKGIENAGELHVNDGQMQFVVDGDKADLENLGDKNEVRFKVQKDPKPKKRRKKAQGEESA
jgi:hypothetical protein